MDSLNGILIGGMLSRSVGSLITGFFNLGPFDVEVIEEVVRAGSSSSDKDEKVHYLQFTITLQDRVHKKSFKLSERKAKLVMKIVNRTEIIKNKLAVRINDLKEITQRMIVKVTKK